MELKTKSNKAVQRGHFAALLDRVNYATLHSNTVKQSCKMPVNGDVLPKKMTPLSNAEIDSIEQELGHKLPGLYRKLLGEEGYGSFGSRDIYDPRRIPEIYGCHFDDQADLFNRYFPFGCDNETQELWIVSVGDEKAATIWHETNPDDYIDEEWLSYEDWISKHLDR